MSRILIVANDVVASRMAGPGIRCYELGKVLVREGHDVAIVGVGSSDLSSSSLLVYSGLNTTRFRELAGEQDAILLEGISLVRYPFLRGASVPIIVDLYDPFPLALLSQEAGHTLSQQEHESRGIAEALHDMLKLGDFFLCASEIQRDFWLGSLLGEGRVNPRTWAADPALRSLIDVVPFGLPAAPPPDRSGDRKLPVGALEPDDVVLLWGGGIYNWFDPLTLIRALAQVRDTEPHVKLLFMSTKHPNADIPAKMWMTNQARRLADELGLTGSHVFFHEDWVSYSERAQWLAAADCGVSTHFDNAETRFAYRTRILDYIWAGLPIICTAGDHFAKLVGEQNLGWVVPPQDVDALSIAIGRMAADADLRARVSRRVSQQATLLTWEEMSRPLRAFVKSPHRAADGIARAGTAPAHPGRARAAIADRFRLARTAWRYLITYGPRATWRKAARWRERSRSAERDG